jgi:hypothetical protein
MRRLLLLLGTAAFWLARPDAARSQSRDTVPLSAPRQAAEPVAAPACCLVVRIDSERSIVTARETATGFTFRFAVKTRRLLATLKIGNPVWADFANKTVKLKATDVQPCCAIVAQETP